MIVGNRESSHFTAVPDEFIDRYMPLANGEFVKVYLYLLRLSAGDETEITVCSMADFLACTEADIVRAMRYWERQGLLCMTEKKGTVERVELTDRAGSAKMTASMPQKQASVPSFGAGTSDSLPLSGSGAPASAAGRTESGSEAGNSTAAGNEGKKSEKREPVSGSEADRRPVMLSVGDFLTDGRIPSEQRTGEAGVKAAAQKPSGTEKSGSFSDGGVSSPLQTAGAAAAGEDRRGRTDLPEERIASVREHGDFRQFAYVAETYFRRPLTSKETQLFAYLYDSLGFSEDLLEYLLEYCIDTGHRNARYIESVAFGWYDEGITTVGQAKEMHQSYKRENREVMKAFGISGRVLNDEERRQLGYWLKDLGMPLPVIVEACHQTMASIHSPSFAYANSILESWKKAGVTTAEQAKSHVQQRREARKAEDKAKTEESADRRRNAQRPKNRFQNYRGREVDYDALLAGNAAADYSKR